jgi:hypothetical protein
MVSSHDDELQLTVASHRDDLTVLRLISFENSKLNHQITLNHQY